MSTRCVCGHPRIDHRDTVMSVPLPLVRDAIPGAPTGFPDTATLTQQQCWCGCCQYEQL